jgi:hypothetical protein
MSHVTDVIITASLLDDDKQPALQAWFDAHRKGEAGPRRVDQHAGGGKALQTAVYIGAHNYITDDEIVALLRSVPWDVARWVQCFVKHEHEDHYSPLGEHADP